MSKRQAVIYHILSVLLLLGSVAMSVFVFRTALIRLIESGRDFGLSIAFYFAELFGFEHNIAPTVTQLSSVSWVEIMPVDFSGYAAFLKNYGSTLINTTNIKNYFLLIFSKFDIVYIIGITLFLLGLGLYCIFKLLLNKPNNNYNKDTLPLRAVKFLSKVFYLPCKKFVLMFIEFIKQHKFYLTILLIIWLFNINIIPIVLEIIAYIFYFAISIDIVTLPIQGYKLIMDIVISLKSIPVFIWVIIAIIIFQNWRKKWGLFLLIHKDKQNQEILSDLPVVSLFVGTMGTGKDTINTDIALSQSIRFRNKAYELMKKNDLRFPYFPWINLENVLKILISNHNIYTLANCRKFIFTMKEQWLKEPINSNIFDYDFKRYGIIYNNGLEIKNIWDVLTSYAQLYFIYCQNTSLIISNHSIREDNILLDNGNFPLWNNDFFQREPEISKANSQYSHILDMDTLRLGEKMIEDNEFADFAEFGVFVIGEVGKDRGNKNDYILLDKNPELTVSALKTIIKKYKDVDYFKKEEIMAKLEELDKKHKKICNPLTDYFNLMIKMFRHMATIDNFCFASLIMNDQRAMSLNADARELCDIFTLTEKTQKKVLYPFFEYEEMIHEFLIKRFEPYYEKIRFCRGDNTLFTHIFKTLTATINKRHEKISNTFGCFDVIYIKEHENTDCKIKAAYHILPRKVYANRFSSNGFSAFFEAKAARSKVGIMDIPTYNKNPANIQELDSTHSYFINNILKMMVKKDTE